MSKALHVVVSGRVQGVYFRAWTRETAQKYNIRGWVRNKPDGSVEIKARGEEEDMDAFVKSLHEGPPAARVDKVEPETISPTEEFDDFRIRY